MAKCIITGCDLDVPEHGKWCHGDLFEDEGFYIFNACLYKGEAAWNYVETESGTKLLTILCHDYFERRGVIVVRLASATLNKRASDYVKNAGLACWGTDAQC